MIHVLLIHAGIIPHYRVPIYSYLSNYLRRFGFELIIVSNGIQAESPDVIEFKFVKMKLSVLRITRFIYRQKFDVIIGHMGLKHTYLFPTYLITKRILRRKIIYWGHGRDLLNTEAKLKNLAYTFEKTLSDAIILYAEHLKKYLPKRFHRKIFIANNTLYSSYKGFPTGKKREDILAEYGIKTKKNIICIGRMQKRKKLDHLVEALAYMNRSDIGLILIGPDPDGALNNLNNNNIYKLGPIYGDKKHDLLCSADVCCIPGAVGLSIVDAFHSGLPFVTEERDESAEIMYLKNGVNGFIVPKNNITSMSQKLLLLLDDDELRKMFSKAAKKEINENGSMEIFCSGFRKALFYVSGKSNRAKLKLDRRDAN